MPPPRRRWTAAARLSALHPPARMARPGGSRNAPVRRPRVDRTVANAGKPQPDVAAASGSAPLAPAPHPLPGGLRDQAMNPTQVVEDIVSKQLKAKKDIPDFTIGDTVNVHVRIIEGDKERIQ